MNQRITIILFTSIFFNIFVLVIATFFVQRKGGLSYLFQKVNSSNSAKTDYHPAYLHKKSQFEILPKSDLGIIFLGDSLTDEGEWTELLGTKIKKRGIGGDTTDRMLNRLNEIVESNPKKIFLMVGINDLINEGRTVEETSEFYKMIMAEFRNKIPNTEVFIQSVLPINNQVTRYWQNTDNVVKLNSHLINFAKEFKYQYIDVYSHLSDSENQLDSQYTFDGVHLNGQGYLVWLEAIQKYVIDGEFQN